MASTLCRDCIFAIWDDNEQTGCKFDRIEKFEENGAEIVGQDDGTKKYFMISGRYCNACRDHDWGNKNKPRKKWKQIVENSIKVQMDIIIDVKPENNLDDIIRTLASAYRQCILPQSVVIIYNKDNEQVTIPDIISEIKNEYVIPWHIENSLSNAMKVCNGMYQSIFNAGHEIPNTFIETINHALNVDLKRFAAILPDSNGNGTVLMKKAGKSLEEIVNRGECTNTSYMIKHFSELFNETKDCHCHIMPR